MRGECEELLRADRSRENEILQMRLGWGTKYMKCCGLNKYVSMCVRLSQWSGEAPRVSKVNKPCWDYEIPRERDQVPLWTSLFVCLCIYVCVCVSTRITEHERAIETVVFINGSIFEENISVQLSSRFSCSWNSSLRPCPNVFFPLSAWWASGIKSLCNAIVRIVI